MVYHLGFTYKDAYACPVWQRFWFINRLKKELDTAKNSNTQTASKRNNSGSRIISKAF